jgi:hypothetical protein
VQLRRAHVVELAREDVVLKVIGRQLGHYANLGTASISCKGSTPKKSSPRSTCAMRR